MERHLVDDHINLDREVRSSDEFDPAAERLQEALEAAQDVDDPAGEIVCLCNLAIAFEARGLKAGASNVLISGPSAAAEITLVLGANEEQLDGQVAIQRPIEDVHGNGGLLTTVGDLLTWNRALSEGRFGPEFTRRMHERGRLNDGTEMAGAMPGEPACNRSRTAP